MTVLISMIPVLSGTGRLLRAHTFAAGGFDRGFRDNGLDRDKPTEAAAAGPGMVRGRGHRVAVETRIRGRRMPACGSPPDTDEELRRFIETVTAAGAGNGGGRELAGGFLPGLAGS